MATWFAQNSSVNIDSVNQWNSAADGSGSWLTWASLDPADVLVANAKTSITINVNVTCATITTTASGGTAGGGFLLAAGVTVTANLTAGSSTVITRTASGAESFVVGNVSSGASTADGINNTSTGNITITGNVTGGSAGAAIGLRNSSTGNIKITGNVSASSGAGSWGVFSSGAGSVTVIGNVTGGSAGSAWGINNTSTGLVNVTGTVTGGTGSSNHGIINTSSASVQVTGSVIGGSGSGANGINSSSTGIVSVTGTITATDTANAVYALTASSMLILGSTLVSSTNGTLPVVSGKMLIHASTELTHTYRVNNAGVPGIARSLYTGGVNLGQPVVANVRSGTTYGASSEYTGTLAVPSPTLVAIGVPTDNTVGSYAPGGGASAADIADAVWDEARSGHATAGTFGEKVNAELDSASINAIADQVWDEATSGHTTSGTYGGRIVRAANSNVEVQITGSYHIAADVHEFQAGVITAGDFAANSLTALALAADAVAEIQSGLATAASIVTLRGADSDTLKTLSDQIDTVSTNVSSIASVSREAF